MPEVTFTLSDELFQLIAARFGQAAAPEVAAAAVEEFLLWMTAEERPTSISELETGRIFLVYQRLRKDELPTAEEIGKFFNLPMGRSRYIVQNLNYKYPGFMRVRLIRAIKTAFEKGENSEDGLPAARIPKECLEYFLAVMTELLLDKKVSSMPAYKVLSEVVRVEIGVNDRKPLLQRLQDDLDRYQK